MKENITYYNYALMNGDSYTKFENTEYKFIAYNINGELRDLLTGRLLLKDYEQEIKEIDVISYRWAVPYDNINEIMSTLSEYVNSDKFKDQYVSRINASKTVYLKRMILEEYIKTLNSKKLAEKQEEPKKEKSKRKYYKYALQVDGGFIFGIKENVKKDEEMGKSLKFIAYEENEIIKDFITNVELVPENASFIPDNAIIYSDIEEITRKELYEFLKVLIYSSPEESFYIKKAYIDAIACSNSQIEEYIQSAIEEKIDEYLLNRKLI